MSAIYLLRVCTFIFTIMCAVPVFTFSLVTTQVLEETNLSGTLSYSNIGIVWGVLTLLSLPIMQLTAWQESVPRSAILVELLWLGVLFLLSFVTGVIALNDGLSGVPSCLLPINADVATVCGFASPVGIYALVSAALLLCYGVSVFFLSRRNARMGKEVWGAHK